MIGLGVNLDFQTAESSSVNSDDWPRGKTLDKVKFFQWWDSLSMPPCSTRSGLQLLSQQPTALLSDEEAVAWVVNSHKGLCPYIDQGIMQVRGLGRGDLVCTDTVAC